MYQFTSDWFSGNIANWTEILARQEVKPSRVLEIGSYEGRSTTWIIDNVLAEGDAHVVAIDLWEEGSELDQRGMGEVERRFDENVALARRDRSNIRVDKLKGKSIDVLSSLIAGGRAEYFDLIYIDGSHMASDVIGDLVLSFRLCKNGGLIFCDDYLGGTDRQLSEAPKIAIDSFYFCFHRQLRIIPALLYQMYFQKVHS